MARFIPLLLLLWSAAAAAQTPLLDAVFDAPADSVAALLAAGADPDEAADGMTPLLAAINANRPEVARLLIERGADPNLSVENGPTPLGRVVATNDTLGVIALLAAGANPSMRDATGSAPLHRAARFGSIDAMHLLLAAGADPSRTDGDRATPLHHAVGHDPRGVEVLIEAGADPMATDARGDTPLHQAARGAHPDVLQLLAQQGVDLDARGQNGMTPLMQTAAWSADAADVAQDLIEAGADVTLANDDGRTALHFAAAFDAPDVARVLLTAGADPNAQPLDESGSPSPPPLFEAFNGSVEALVAPILLAAGADPLADTGVGFPAIAAAARDGHLAIVRAYLNDHPEALVPEMIPLAARRGDADGVQMLLALGAPADGRLFGDQTALHSVVTPINPYTREDLGDAYAPAATLRILLAAGLDPDADGCGTLCGTPLHTAAWEARLDLIEILLAAGADASLTTEHEDGDTLDAAGLVRFRLENPGREPAFSHVPAPGELRAVLTRLE